MNVFYNSILFQAVPYSKYNFLLLHPRPIYLHSLPARDRNSQLLIYGNARAISPHGSARQEFWTMPRFLLHSVIIIEEQSDEKTFAHDSLRT